MHFQDPKDPESFKIWFKIKLHQFLTWKQVTPNKYTKYTVNEQGNQTMHHGLVSAEAMKNWTSV